MEKKVKDRQNKAIMAHLAVWGSITSLDAIRMYDITRLSARIWDIRHIYGWNIKTTNATVETKWGKTTVAHYELVDEIELAEVTA
jgi:hypothetical protein